MHFLALVFHSSHHSFVMMSSTTAHRPHLIYSLFVLDSQNSVHRLRFRWPYRRYMHWQMLSMQLHAFVDLRQKQKQINQNQNSKSKIFFIVSQKQLNSITFMSKKKEKIQHEWIERIEWRYTLCCCKHQSIISTFFFLIRTRTHSKTHTHALTQSQSNTHCSFFLYVSTRIEFYFSQRKINRWNTRRIDFWSFNWMLKHFLIGFVLSTRFSSRIVRTCDVVYTETQVALVALENRTCIFFYFFSSLTANEAAATGARTHTHKCAFIRF